MHEASLAEGLLKLVNGFVESHNKQNPENQITRIKCITCEAGLLGGFELNALAQCVEMFAEGTICDGVMINVKYRPLACTCRECGKGFELRKRIFACPFCKSHEIDFNGGHGLDLVSLDAECEEDNG